MNSKPRATAADLVNQSLSGTKTRAFRKMRSFDNYDNRVAQLSEQLIEIEQRLIATGLHIFGRAAELKEKADLFRMVASFDRPEHGAVSLPRLVAEGLGIDGYDDIVQETTTSETKDLIDQIAKEAIARFFESGANAASTYLSSRANVEVKKSLPTFRLLSTINQHLDSNSELSSLVRALRGEYIQPGPGADIVQNPLVLPTGRNTHAVNPYSVPSQAAFLRAKPAADALLQRYMAEHGRYPRALALVLWGLDNIKTQGEGVAQALWLLGVRPVRDALNRATDIEVISLSELSRPRIDGVMTGSGIFRDLFTPTMALLDKAVRRVATLDEPLDMNYVRRNVLEKLNANDVKGEQAGRLRTQERNVSERIDADGFEFDDAVTRVFSNAPGNYGTNVNFMVMQSAWENDA